MIIGTGSDICDIRRIEKTLERFAARFIQRVFTPAEQAKAERRKGAGMKVYAGTFAKRFAAKEACAKALGTGLNQGVYFKDIEVINLPSGQPTIKLHARAAALLASKSPRGWEPNIQLTLTDEYPYAQALVIIELVNKNLKP